MGSGAGVQHRGGNGATRARDAVVGQLLDAQERVGGGAGITGYRVARPGMRAWVQAGLQLADLAPPDGDPDTLLGLPSCHLVKDQTKVTVGIVPAGAVRREPAAAAVVPLYVKRYNVFSARVRLLSLVQRSPALRALAGTQILASAGFRTPAPVAAVEYRRWGMLERSFFLTVALRGAVPADQYWWGLRRAPVAARRAFLTTLARLFAALHAAGIYHNDMKDANLLVRAGGDGTLEYFLLDLERLRWRPLLSMRRRVKNLVQLHRTLGRVATPRENLYFLRAYLGPQARNVRTRRRWRRRVCAAARRKDVVHVLRGVS